MNLCDVLGYGRGCEALASSYAKGRGNYIHPAARMASVGSTNFIGCSPLKPMGQFESFDFDNISADAGAEFASQAPTVDFSSLDESAGWGLFGADDMSSYGGLGQDWNLWGNPGDISPEIGSSGMDSLMGPDTYSDLGNAGQDSVGMTVQNATSSGFSNFLSGVLKTGVGLGIQTGLASLLGSPNKPSGQNAQSPNTNLNVVPKSPTAGLSNGFMLPNALNVANQAALTSTSMLPAGVSPSMITLGLIAVGAVLLLKK